MPRTGEWCTSHWSKTVLPRWNSLRRSGREPASPRPSPRLPPVGRAYRLEVSDHATDARRSVSPPSAHLSDRGRPTAPSTRAVPVRYRSRPGRRTPTPASTPPGRSSRQSVAASAGPASYAGYQPAHSRRPARGHWHPTPSLSLISRQRSGAHAQSGRLFLPHCAPLLLFGKPVTVHLNPSRLLSHQTAYPMTRPTPASLWKPPVTGLLYGKRSARSSHNQRSREAGTLRVGEQSRTRALQ
jgi:hypothetical protein